MVRQKEAIFLGGGCRILGKDAELGFVRYFSASLYLLSTEHHLLLLFYHLLPATRLMTAQNISTVSTQREYFRVLELQSRKRSCMFDDVFIWKFREGKCLSCRLRVPT